MRLTLLILLSFISTCLGQIKIGDIEVSEELAKEYFLDCYTHQDTTRYIMYASNEGAKDIISGNWKPYNVLSWRYANKDESDGWFGGLPHIVCVTNEIINITPRKISANDFAEWFLKRKKNESTK